MCLERLLILWKKMVSNWQRKESEGTSHKQLRKQTTPGKAKILVYRLELAVGIGLDVIADKTEYKYFNQRGDISSLIGGPLKLVDKFI